MSKVVPASSLLRYGWRRPSRIVERIVERRPEPLPSAHASGSWPMTPVRILARIPDHVGPVGHGHYEAHITRKGEHFDPQICNCGIVLKNVEELEEHWRRRRLQGFPCDPTHLTVKDYNRQGLRKGFRVVDQLTNPSYSWLAVQEKDLTPVDTIELADVEQEVLDHPLVDLPDMSGQEGYDSDRHALICSYSAIEGRPNTFYVPGEPPLFVLRPGSISKEVPLEVAPAPPVSLIRDEIFGPAIRTWDPVFRSLEIMNPDFRFDDIDIMADAPVIKNLAAWAYGRPAKPVRFAVRLVHDTLILTYSMEELPKMLGPRPKLEDFVMRGTGRSLGVAFERVVTRFPAGSGLEDTDESGHFRLIRSRLGPFACAIRSEADAAYYDDFEYPEHLEEPKLPKSPPPRATKSGGATAIRRGRIIPQSDIAEVKTIRAESQDETDLEDITSWPNAYDYLATTYWTRPSHMISARFVRPMHGDNAIFHHIQIIDCQLTRDIWQKKWYVQGTHRRLVSLIKRIRDAVARRPHKECTLIVTPHAFYGTDHDHQKIVLFDRNPATTERFISEEDIKKYWYQRAPSKYSNKRRR
ncbi:hypothetical protein QBC43DRAFT_326293 [Cladorrhinum sp. PSN259]|nr:hypothetical protein QBC43DRAFT_326293 [Cladorrhinum sp. PSN259]